MNAITLGPILLSAPRFAALVGLGVFLVAAHFAGRRHPRLGDWAWTAALIVVLGARLGYVLENAGAYARAPLTALYFWQGGFAPLWGIGLAAVYTLLATPVRRAALPAAVAGLVAWGGVGLLLSPAESEPVARPETALAGLAGEPTTLAEHAAGRPLVVNLWAPWCPPCRREMPMLMQAADATPEVAFALVDQGSTEAEVRAFLEDQGLSDAHVLLDRGSRLMSELNAAGLPTTLVFDADGELHYAHVGEISRVELDRRTRAVLDER